MSSFITDKNIPRLEYRNRKKMILKSLCITKFPQEVTFQEIKEVCNTFGRIHSIHESVKNCPYSFVNFEFLENEEEVIVALSKIGVECKRGQRKQQEASKKPQLLPSEDLQAFNEVAQEFSHKKFDCIENWEADDCDELVANLITKPVEEEKQDLPEKKASSSVSENNSIDGPVTTLKVPCVYCKEEATLVCLRCGDYYCSKDCQRLDWPSHRYICFPMPDLVLPSFRKNQANPNAVQKTHQVPNLTELQKPDQPINFKKFQITTKSSILPTPKIQRLCNVTLKSETEIEVYPNMPAAGDLVNIVSVFNARHLYVRSLEPAADKEFRTNLYNINRICKTSSRPFNSLPGPKSYACTDYQDDGLFYRVRVVKADDVNNITVRYVDFGNVEVKSLDNLRELPEECKQFKIFKMAVTLNEIPNVLEGNKKMLNLLQQIADNISNKYKIFYENERAILIDAFTNVNLNRQLLELISYRKPIKDKDESSSGRGSDSSSNGSLDTVKSGQKHLPLERVLNPPFTFEYLPIGEDISVIIVDNSLLELGCFSCCMEKDASIIERISKKAQSYADKDPNPYIPVDKEYVLARFADDSEWYRAQVSEVIEDEDNTFEVTFIDYGNVTKVKPEDIRHYPETFTETCKTTTCLISDLPYEIDEDVLRELQKEIGFPSMKTIKQVLNITNEGYASVIMGLSI